MTPLDIFRAFLVKFMRNRTKKNLTAHGRSTQYKTLKEKSFKKRKNIRQVHKRVSNITFFLMQPGHAKYFLHYNPMDNFNHF